MKVHNSRALRAALGAFLFASLGACSLPKSYVVLLANDDGSTGKVTVTAKEGATELQEAGTGTYIGWSENKAIVFEKGKMAQDFGTALAGRPAAPKSFVLYFDAGTSNLTTESQNELQRLYDELAARASPDVSIVGHTDTVGDSQQNEALGLARARIVADLLVGDKLSAERTSVESHGEKNLLVPTGDDVDMPRNRRVEVTVR